MFANGRALIIGIANYINVRKLPATVLNDAKDIYEIIKSQDYCGYPDENVRLLLDHQATAINFLDGLRWLAQQALPDDTVIIYYSGHGGRVTRGTSVDYYLLPFDCDMSTLLDSAISGTIFNSILASIKAQRVVVIFDCCYSNGIAESKDAGAIVIKPGFDDTYYDQLASGSGRVIISSSRSNEVSLVLPNMKNSLFTYHMLRALEGQAYSGRGNLICVFDIFDYVSREVSTQRDQHPVFRATDLENNFGICLFKGQLSQIELTAANTRNYSMLNRLELLNILIDNFSNEELRILCLVIEQMLERGGFRQHIDMELIGGSTRTEKALNLIEFLERRNFINYLIEAIRHERPFLDKL